MTDVVSPTASPSAHLKARLDDPKVAAALDNVLDHADLLALLVVGLDGFVSRGEVIGNALADSIKELRTAADAPDNPFHGLDLKQVATSLAEVAKASSRVTPALTRVVDSGLIDAVMASGITEPAVIDQVGRLGKGLAKGAQLPSQPVSGPFALLKSLKDPDIARGLGFLVNVLKSVGAELGSGRR